MLNDARKTEIENLVTKINSFSERYQLSHATVAIERLYKDKVQEEYQEKFAQLRQELFKATDPESISQLNQKAQELKKESNKRINISIEYSERMGHNSSRITRTPNDTFLISLPKCMANIRKEDGNINFELLDELRKLVAHELGHIVLHSGIFGTPMIFNDPDTEKEADYFADKLLDLRKKHSKEIMSEKSK